MNKEMIDALERVWHLALSRVEDKWGDYAFTEDTGPEMDEYTREADALSPVSVLIEQQGGAV